VLCHLPFLQVFDTELSKLKGKVEVMSELSHHSQPINQMNMRMSDESRWEEEEEEGKFAGSRGRNDRSSLVSIDARVLSSISIDPPDA
jgi:hypothetical protein